MHTLARAGGRRSRFDCEYLLSTSSFFRFEYLTSRIRPVPRDLEGTAFAKPSYLHLVCVPERAVSFVAQIEAIEDWNPILIFEPMEGSCTPGEFPTLKSILGQIDVLRQV